MRLLLQWLKGEMELVLITPEEFRDLEKERETAIIRAESLPTFENAWGCTNCSVIQARPADARCQLCRSEQVINLALQLQRGSQRIDRRRARRP